MTQFKLLNLIRDRNEVQRRIAMLNAVVERTGDSARLRLPAGWIAVPVESGLHFDEGDRDRILALCQKEGRQRLWAIALESLGEDMEAFDVPATAEGIGEFDHELGHFNYALLPEDVNWVIVCTTDDYFVVMSPSDVAKVLVGKTVAEAYTEFKEYIGDREFLHRRLQDIQELSPTTARSIPLS